MFSFHLVAWFKKKKEQACKRLRYGNLTKTKDENIGFDGCIGT